MSFNGSEIVVYSHNAPDSYTALTPASTMLAMLIFTAPPIGVDFSPKFSHRGQVPSFEHNELLLVGLRLNTRYKFRMWPPPDAAV